MIPRGSQRPGRRVVIDDECAAAIGGGGSALSAHALPVLAKLPPEDERAHRPLTQLFAWALTDAPPYATLLFSTASTAPKDEKQQLATSGRWHACTPGGARRRCVSPSPVPLGTACLSRLISREAEIA